MTQALALTLGEPAGTLRILAAGLIGGVAFGALAAPAYSYPYGAGYGYAAYDGDGY